MSKKIAKTPTEVKTKTKLVSGTVIAEAESLAEHGPLLFDAPPAQVEVGMGATINQGNFESTRIHITVTRPAENTNQAIENVFKEIKEYIQKKMSEEVAELHGTKVDKEFEGVVYDG